MMSRLLPFAAMLILLPPSESKSPDLGEGVFRVLEPDLVKDVEGVLRHLRHVKKSDRPGLYKTKDAVKAERFHQLNLDVLEAPCLPALERYAGVVYENFDYASLRCRKRASASIYIVSGMFGLIGGGRRIPDYKLPLDPWLTKYWRDINTQRLAAIAQGIPVLSLLPQTHAKAIGYTNLLTVDFKTAGGKKSAGHFGKAIKGKFVRWLVMNDIQGVESFKDFEEDGYRWDGKDFVQG
jgi:uncharacterized protein